MNPEFHTSSWSIQEERFILHPLRFMYWENESMILLSDVHAGKSTELLQHGIYLPLEQINSLYHRLRWIGTLYPKSHLVIVGDMVHGKENKEWAQFIPVFKNFAHVTLVKGNHDKFIDTWQEKAGITIQNEIKIRNVLITHEENLIQEDIILNIHGHIHPWLKLSGKAKQSIALPCFYKKGKHFCLPAFNTLTGKNITSFEKGDLAWGIMETSCIPYVF